MRSMQAVSAANSSRVGLRPATPAADMSAAGRRTLRTPRPGSPALPIGLKASGLVSEADRAAFFAETPRSAEIAALWAPQTQRRPKGQLTGPGRAHTAVQGQPAASRDSTGKTAALAQLRSSGGSAVSAAIKAFDELQGPRWPSLPTGNGGSTGVFPSGGSRPMATGSRPTAAAPATDGAAATQPGGAQSGRDKKSQRLPVAAASVASSMQQPMGLHGDAALPRWQSDSAVARIVSVWEDRAATAAAATADQQSRKAAELQVADDDTSPLAHAHLMLLPHQSPGRQPDKQQQQQQQQQQQPAHHSTEAYVSQQSHPPMSPYSPVRHWQPYNAMSDSTSANPLRLLHFGGMSQPLDAGHSTRQDMMSGSNKGSLSLAGTPGAPEPNLQDGDKASQQQQQQQQQRHSSHSSMWGSMAPEEGQQQRSTGTAVKQPALPSPTAHMPPAQHTNQLLPGDRDPRRLSGHKQQQRRQQPPKAELRRCQAAPGMYPDSILADSVMSCSTACSSVAGRSLASSRLLHPLPAAQEWLDLQQEPGGSQHGPILHSGWLLKARRRGSRRSWRRTWAYLLPDRLCFAPEAAPPGAPDGEGVTKYVPLERIPVRGRPRGYSPSPGIAPVDPRLLDSGGSRRRTQRQGVFSVQCGGRTLFLRAPSTAEAEEWIRRITDAWAACSGTASAKPIMHRQPPEPQQQHHAVHQLAGVQQRSLFKHDYRGSNDMQQPLVPLPSRDHVIHGSERHRLQAAARSSTAERHVQQSEAHDAAAQCDRPAEAGSEPPAERQWQQPQALQQVPQQMHMQQRHHSSADSGHQSNAQPAPRSQGSAVAQRYHVVVRTANSHRCRRDATSQTPAQLQLQMHGTRGCGGQHNLDLQDAGWAGSIAHHYTVADPPLGELAAVTVGIAVPGVLSSASRGRNGSNSAIASVQLSSVSVTAPDGRSWSFAADKHLDAGCREVVLPASRIPESNDDNMQPAAEGYEIDSLDDAAAAADARASWQPAWLPPPRQRSLGAAQQRDGRSRQQHTSGAGSAGQHESANSVQKPQAASRLPTASVQCQTPCHAHVQTGASAPPDERLAAGSSRSDSMGNGQAASGAGRLMDDDAAQQATAAVGGNADAAAPRAAPPELTCYRVTVWTADAPGCYTEGRPRIVLFGADGSSTGPQQLDNGCSAFERGGVDVCEFTAPDVGRIAGVALATDASCGGSDAASWCIRKLEVLQNSSDHVATFQPHNWIVGSHLGSPVLLADAEADAPVGLDHMPAHEQPHEADAQGEPRKTTADYHGEAQESTRHMMHTPQTADAPLLDLRDPGERDTNSCGQLPAAGGSAASSSRDDGEVSEDAAAVEQLDTMSEGAGSSPAANTPTDGCAYHLAFYTSRRLGAGTSAQVFIELIGPRGTSGPLQLPKVKRGFRAGRATGFTLQGVPDVGPVRELRVGTDATGLLPAWHLQTVELQDLRHPHQPATVFPCDKWISASNGHERILWARE